MKRTFAYAVKTLADDDPGAAAVMAKMSELLFVEAVRRYLAGLPREEIGCLAGLRDPAIGRALSLMHARLDKDWTADALAREVNLSRSAFADHFTALIGVPPMRYLLNWRMQVATQKLRKTRRTIAEIAFEVGYQSEAAFTPHLDASSVCRRQHGVKEDRAVNENPPHDRPAYSDHSRSC